MNEMHCRKIAAESRVAACAVLAAGEVFKPLLFGYQDYAATVFRLARQSDQAEGEDLVAFTKELLAVFMVLTDALSNRFMGCREAHALRLGISVEQVDERLYPTLPGEHADLETRRAFQRSITGHSDQLRRLGFVNLGQERGHAMHEIIRIVWVIAANRAEVETFMRRLEEIVAQRRHEDRRRTRDESSPQPTATP